jgi:hypothetical protein
VDLKLENACVPWFYPLNGTEIRNFCDPWKTEKFQQIMRTNVPAGLCHKCLPDCASTEYESSMTSAELQKCDATTTGSTGLLCNLVKGSINPSPWVDMAQNEYIKANQTVPWFLETISSKKTNNSTRFSNKRSRTHEEGTEMFSTEVERHFKYNAFETDIGIINVFFTKKEVPKFVTRNRMSSFDFVYQFGGSVGFVMGISIISLIEIAYWISLGILRNFAKLF